MPLPFDLSASLSSVSYQGLSKAWSVLDPRSRSLENAIDDGIARARAKAWTETTSKQAGLPSEAKDGVADFRALVIATAVTRGILTDSKRSGDPSDEKWASVMTNTWIVIAKRSGYKGEKPEDMKPGSQAELSLIAILALIVGGLIIAGVITYLIYKTAEVVERQMSISAESDELVRLHAEAQKIIDNHIAQEQKEGHPLPYTPDEMAVLDKLAMAQKHVTTLIAPPEVAPPPGPTPGGWNVALLAAVAGLLGLGYFFLRSGAK